MPDSTENDALSEHLRVGEVAEACDVTADTIRFYEQEGLIPEPPRFESSGYRAYPPQTIERVRFVQNAHDLGFSLIEVGELLELRGDSEASCAEVRKIAEQKAEEVRGRISKLEEMLQGLESLTSLCPGDVSTDECPFLEILSDEPK